MKTSEIDIKLSSQKSKRTPVHYRRKPDWKLVFCGFEYVNVKERVA
jgi:hypothetical protein